MYIIDFLLIALLLFLIPGAIVALIKWVKFLAMWLKRG